MTINLFVQEDRSPSGTGRAQFQTHANEQRTSNGNVQATTNTTVDPNQLAPTHPHWAFCARTGEACVAGKDAFTSIYTAGDFLGRHSQERSGTPAQSRKA